MNKIVNTIIFVVGATIFLSVTILVIFFALLLPLILLLPTLDEGLKTIFIGVIFVGSLLGGLLIYNAVMKLLVKKFDLEKYLLTRKQKPR
jgi:hypothetical protein